MKAHYFKTRAPAKVTMRGGSQQLSFDWPAGVSIAVTTPDDEPEKIGFERRRQHWLELLQFLLEGEGED